MYSFVFCGVLAGYVVCAACLMAERGVLVSWGWVFGLVCFGESARGKVCVYLLLRIRRSFLLEAVLCSWIGGASFSG